MLWDPSYAAILPNMQRVCGCSTICQVFPTSPLLSLLSYLPFKIGNSIVTYLNTFINIKTCHITHNDIMEIYFKLQYMCKQHFETTSVKQCQTHVQLGYGQFAFNIIVSSLPIETFKTW